MDDELIRMWKNVTWPNLRYYPGICLEGLRKTTQTPIRAASLQSRFEPGPREYEAGVLTIQVHVDSVRLGL
jgi:hypothetical protein